MHLLAPLPSGAAAGLWASAVHLIRGSTNIQTSARGFVLFPRGVEGWGGGATSPGEPCLETLNSDSEFYPSG